MFKRLTAIILAVSFLACAAACGKKEPVSEYGGLFDTSYVHSVEVELSEEDWEDLKANPLNKTKYRATVTIDGTETANAAFSTKGNTSLSQVADSDSDRYSFKINFGKYVKGKTYYGLKKLALNNIMSDATYMKDYLSYTIMRKAGVYAPLISYTSLVVNGESFGLYIAIEDVSESFIVRNYGDSSGTLYKPETVRIGNMLPDGERPGPGQGFPNGEAPGSMPNGEAPGSMPGGAAPGGPPSGEGAPTDRPEGGPPDRPGQDGWEPGFEMDSNGADLVYKDDEASSYSDIFDNAENDVTEEDEKELIRAIKALNTGEDVEKYWDVDQLIRYFAAHNLVLNYDSYTGNMLHNYYLFERDGKVTVFPWDYNLAFGGFNGGSDAVGLINTAIDTPLKGAEESVRPLWNVIASNEEYLARYHSVFSTLLADFFENGECEKEIERVQKMISPYIKDSSVLFYSFDQFSKAAETLKSVCKLRAESIRKQLDGSLASVSVEQRAEDMVDASSVDIADMGTQGGGGPNGGHGDLPAGPPDGGMQPGPGGQMPSGTPPVPPNGGSQ